MNITTPNVHPYKSFMCDLKNVPFSTILISELFISGSNWRELDPH